MLTQARSEVAYNFICEVHNSAKMTLICWRAVDNLLRCGTSHLLDAEHYRIDRSALEGRKAWFNV